MSGGLQKCFDYLGASPFVGLCEVTCDGQCGQVEFQPQAGQSHMGGKPRLRAWVLFFPIRLQCRFIGSAPRRRELPVEEESTQKIVD